MLPWSTRSAAPRVDASLSMFDWRVLSAETRAAVSAVRSDWRVSISPSAVDKRLFNPEIDSAGCAYQSEAPVAALTMLRRALRSS